MIASFVARWIWPAGGSGGIPGDVVATLVWVIIAAVATAIIYPPLRHWIEHELDQVHAKLDAHAKLLEHVIKYHPDIPDHNIDVPYGRSARGQNSNRRP